MDFPLNFAVENYTHNGAKPLQQDSLLDERQQYEETHTEPTYSEDPMSFLRDLDPNPGDKPNSLDNTQIRDFASASVNELAQLDSARYGEIGQDQVFDNELQPSVQLSADFLGQDMFWNETVSDRLVDFQWESDTQLDPNFGQAFEQMVSASPFEFPPVEQTYVSSEENLLQPATSQMSVADTFDLDVVSRVPSVIEEGASSKADIPFDHQSLWSWLTPETEVSKNPFEQASATNLDLQAVVPTKIRKKPSPVKYENFPDKADRRKAKPIASRFQEFGSVSVMPSYVQCLSVVLDYHGYTGTIRQVILNDAITNVAVQAHDVAQQKKLIIRPLEEGYSLSERESLFGTVSGSSGTGTRNLSIISGILQRKIHVRDIHSIVNSVSSVAYVKSGRFNINSPYEPQYYRYELDERGRVVNESKCGMCAFCPMVKFLPFKNSSYLSHMTLEHGIFASNYVVPEGLYYGRYRMYRSNDPLKTRTVKALQCPACFQVIEVACWKNKSNPLLSYFRHFKKIHSNLNKTFTSSSIDPVSLKHQGGDMFSSK